MLTQKKLKELINYYPEFGIFTWRGVGGVKSVKDMQAGSIYKNGYYYIQIDRKRYLAHQLAWLYIYGEIPNKRIKHIDGNKINNKISNLTC
jgi:hypothetical protein